ncbi:MAG TPA: CoA transferase [Dehalococcoidia bacterium]|nr:CoA transferase [Dehalococcoidia bacterium]
MTTSPPSTGPLVDVRVLDLADESGVYAGRILAELGADVIRIEPPGGDGVRSRLPHLDGVNEAERSLYHQHFNAGKRGVTLDIRSPQGAALFRRMVAVADVLIETASPGEMDSLDLGFAALSTTNPNLLYTTITPFGQDGPMRDYRGNDLIGVASSGLMWLNGFPDDPPNQPGAEQSYQMASLVAASTTLIALAGRGRDGGGAHRIDISIQEAASMSTLQHASANAYTWHGNVNVRRGLSNLRGGRDIFQCADGLWISFVVPPYRWEEFVVWLREHRMAAAFEGDGWRDPSHRLEHVAELTEVMASLASRYDRDDFWHEGQRRRLLLMRISTVDEIAGDEQLRVRDYFEEFEGPNGQTLRDTGVAYALSATPAGVPRRAPRLGEHNDEVFGELFGDGDELASLRAGGVV